MAVGQIVRFPEGVGAKEYDAVSAEMDIASNPPDGMIMHCAGELDGRFQVFGIWESVEQIKSFEEGRLKDAQIAVMGEETYANLPTAERVETEIHNYVIP
jgi:hypothetical protein